MHKSDGVDNVKHFDGKIRPTAMDRDTIGDRYVDDLCNSRMVVWIP